MNQAKRIKARILLVEDNRAEADATRAYLDKCGYEVVWVESGTQALKAAKTRNIDCVVLDVLLPDINGTEVCRWLKGNEDTRGLPIIMLTVKSSMQDKVEGLQLGADDYLPKPYDEIELNARIYASLRTKSLQDELRAKNRELQQMLDRMELMAITDPLTGLFNRRKFEAIINAEFTRTWRYQSPLTCVMIDIDHFKQVNDEHGHRTGDHVLSEMTQIIRRNIREVDTPARWGGEEFVILLPETDSQGALSPARRILEQTAAASFSGLPAGLVTVSIGIASAPDPQIDSGERLIDTADLAMYEAKRTGRNRIQLAAPGDSRD
jgi:diguanylate cyclase (GGDEF)-like protein